MNLTSAFPRPHPISTQWLFAAVLTTLIALTLFAALPVTSFTPSQPAQSSISAGHPAPHFQPVPTPSAAMVTTTPVPQVTLIQPARQPSFVPMPVPTLPANH